MFGEPVQDIMSPMTMKRRSGSWLTSSQTRCGLSHTSVVRMFSSSPKPLVSERGSQGLSSSFSAMQNE